MIECIERECYRCGASCFEEIDDGLLSCCFCGVLERLPKTRRPKPIPVEARDEFRFKFGRYSGKTLAEVYADPGGRRYLEWIRETNERLRDVVSKFLDENNAPPCAERP